MFSFVRENLGPKHQTMTAYHPQANGQAKQINRTIITGLLHYVAEHQRDWDLYVNLSHNRSVGKSIDRQKLYQSVWY